MDYWDVWKVENRNKTEHIFSIQHECQASVATSGSELHSRRIFFYAPRGSVIVLVCEDSDWQAVPEFYEDFPNDYARKLLS